MKQSLGEGSTETNPLATAVVSMSFGSTTDFKANFCKIVVRNKNSSMRARPFPTQIHFPTNRNAESTYTPFVYVQNIVFLAVRKRSAFDECFNEWKESRMAG